MFEPDGVSSCNNKDENVITVESEVCCEIPKSEVVEVNNKPIVSGAKKQGRNLLRSRIHMMNRIKMGKIGHLHRVFL